MEDTKRELFGNTLKKLRKRAGLTQNELGRIVDINPMHISKIERGIRNPPRKGNLIKIISALRLNKNESSELFQLSGYSFDPEQNHQAYAYPVGAYGLSLSDLPPDQKKNFAENFSVVKLLIDTMNDPSFSPSEKGEIEKKLFSFINWLIKEVRNKD